MKRPILILGLGNPLRGDDGIGSAVIEALERIKLPPEVELLDGGTVGLGLLGAIAGRQGLLVVDAAEMGRPAGTVLRLQPKEVLSIGSDLRRERGGRRTISPHQFGVVEVLALTEQLGLTPKEATIIAVQVGSLRWQHGLSPAVRESLPHIIATVLAEIDRFQRWVLPQEGGGSWKQFAQVR